MSRPEDASFSVHLTQEAADFLKANPQLTQVVIATTSALLVDFEVRLLAYCDHLRETAEELRADTINRVHAANRIEKIANEIARRES